MTKQEIKNILINNNVFLNNKNEMKQSIAFYIVNELKKEIEAKNNITGMKDREKEKLNEIEFFNAGIRSYYRQEKNIIFYENTDENRKKLFNFKILLDFINKGKTLYNYTDWYIKFDDEIHQPVDITTLGCINQIYFNKDFEMWMLENPKYYNNYDIYNIAINIDSIIDEVIQEQQNNYIISECVMKDGTKEKIYFKKYSDTYRDIVAYTSNKNYCIIENIKETRNKNIPILQNAIYFDCEKAFKNDFVIKNFEIDNWNETIKFIIKNTNIYISINKKENNIIRLCYKYHHDSFYIVNNKKYDIDNWNKSEIRKLNFSNIIKSEKTRSLLNKLIDIIKIDEA